jgi:serine/threonine-protein kinase HipA
MRQAKVLFKGLDAGILTQYDDGKYSFQYHDAWLNDTSKPAISLTLPKKQSIYHSDFLFSFFYNMLPEGSNKQLVCNLNRIDSKDYFGILITTARYDNIGAVQVLKID